MLYWTIHPDLIASSRNETAKGEQKAKLIFGGMLRTHCNAGAGLRRFSPKWCILQFISFICLLISLGGCVGSIAQIVIDTYDYTPFQTKY